MLLRGNGLWGFPEIQGLDKIFGAAGEPFPTGPVSLFRGPGRQLRHISGRDVPGAGSSAVAIDTDGCQGIAGPYFQSPEPRRPTGGVTWGQVTGLRVLTTVPGIELKTNFAVCVDSPNI